MCYQSLNDQPRPSAVPERRAGPTCLDAQSAPLSLEQAGGASPPLWPRYIGSLANEDWSAVERQSLGQHRNGATAAISRPHWRQLSAFNG